MKPAAPDPALEREVDDRMTLRAYDRDSVGHWWDRYYELPSDQRAPALRRFLAADDAEWQR